MNKDQDRHEAMAALAVLFAAAREAEELLAEDDLDQAAESEANRRLRLFMQVSSADGALGVMPCVAVFTFAL